VCAFEAAKFKYQLDIDGEDGEVSVIWVLHDFSVRLFEDGDKPSKALDSFLDSSSASAYLNELRAMKGVAEVGFFEGYEAKKRDHEVEFPFFIQADEQSQRLSLVIVSDDSTFYFVDGVRFPADVVTDFSDKIVEWVYQGTGEMQIVENGREYFQLSGIQICPWNDETVYLKLDRTASTPRVIRQATFWTQAGGSDAVIKQGAQNLLVTNLRTGASSSAGLTLADSLKQNADVCYTFGTANSVNAGAVWAIPISTGQKLYFAFRSDHPSSPDYIIAPEFEGINPYVDGHLVRSQDITSEVRLFTTSGSNTIGIVGVNPDVRAFIFDHLPVKEEFAEEESKLIDAHRSEIGICGSLVEVSDGVWEPQEWENHPYDCTDQLEGDKCMFCKGRANDKVRSVCLERLGNDCNAAFNSPPRSVFCNLEFECPASTFSFSMFLALSLLALFFFAL
jgi:hypothetical protein